MMHILKITFDNYSKKFYFIVQKNKLCKLIKISIMYTGFKANTSINKSTVSGLNQTQLQTLQRQVDTYTRKLELQKRKYFAIQDQHKSVAEEYTKEKEKLSLLKKQNTKAESIILQAKIKNLQSTLDKAVSAYDDTIAYNNRLKGQIDMLRRQKKNYLQMQKSLEQQARKIDQQTNQKMDLLVKKKKRVQDLKLEMVQTKNKNQQQRQSYLSQFSSLQKQYMYDRNPGDISSSKLKNSDLLSPGSNPPLKLQIIDTQPLLKFRLKRIITSNKQKLKIIEQYKKHMMLIQDAFTEIKQKSNINDLDQITTTFIKSEEQNYSLYNYMDSLTQGIDKLEDENRELEQKIRKKQVDDQLKKQGLLDKNGSVSANNARDKMTNANMKDNAELKREIDSKDKQTQSLVSLVQKIRPTLQSVLLDLSASTSSPSSFKAIPRLQHSNLSLNISERNIQEYLSQLQKYINLLLIAKQQAQTKTISQTKDNATVYSKPIPNVNYEDMIKEKQKVEKFQKDQNKFLEQIKFRQYAIQFWEKRKNNNKFFNAQGNQQISQHGNHQTNQQHGLNIQTTNQQQSGSNLIVQNLSNPSQATNNIRQNNITSLNNQALITNNNREQSIINNISMDSNEESCLININPDHEE